MSQLLIAVFGLTALVLAMSQDFRMRRAAPWVGICGQPFWLFATFSTGQVGMGVLCIAYTGVYLFACWVQVKAWRGRMQPIDKAKLP